MRLINIHGTGKVDMCISIVAENIKNCPWQVKKTTQIYFTDAFKKNTSTPNKDFQRRNVNF